MNKYDVFGLAGSPPLYCQSCGGKIEQGEAIPGKFDQFTGERIHNVQLHCENASREEIEAAGGGGNYTPKHTITWISMKEVKE